jgi:AcrR family transcriptional regulator
MRAPPRPAARARFRRQLPEERRLALIEATVASLKRDGHDGLSIRRISAEAGVSIGLINHYFPDKHALVAAAYRHFDAQLVAAFRRAVANAPAAPRKRLRAFFAAAFAPPNLDRDVLAAWTVFWSLYRHSPEIRQVHEETRGGYGELLRELLRDVAEAAPARRMSGRLAGIGLTALLDGLWLEWCLDPDKFRPAEAVKLCEAWVEQVYG